MGGSFTDHTLTQCPLVVSQGGGMALSLPRPITGGEGTLSWCRKGCRGNALSPQFTWCPSHSACSTHPGAFWGGSRRGRQCEAVPNDWKSPERWILHCYPILQKRKPSYREV